MGGWLIHKLRFVDLNLTVRVFHSSALTPPPPSPPTKKKIKKNTHTHKISFNANIRAINCLKLQLQLGKLGDYILCSDIQLKC